MRNWFLLSIDNSKSTTILLVVVSFLIPLIVTTNSLLHHFYVHGPILYDTGLFTFWATHSLDFSIKSIGSFDYQAHMFSHHIFLIFFPLSYFYQLIANLLSEQVFFSLVQGLWPGIIGIATFLIGYKYINKYLLSLVAIATALNPLVFTCIYFPHIEMAIPAFILLFIASSLRNYRFMSWLALICLLSIRQDAGLHAFGILILLTGYFFLHKQERWRQFLLAAAICLGYSIAAFAIKISFFHSEESALVWKFLGSPTYAHLNFNIIIERLKFIAAQREYIYLPMFAIVIIAIIQRSILPILAIVAVFPWMLFHLTAKNDFAGTFYPYTMAPVMVVMFWPLICAVIRKKYFLSLAITQFLICTVSSYLLVGNADIPRNVIKDGFSLSYMNKITPTNQATDIIHNLIKSGALGNFMMDVYIPSFILTDVKRENVYSHRNAKLNYLLAADSIVFFEGADWFRSSFRHLDGRFIYSYPQTNICLASKHKIPQLEGTPFILYRVSPHNSDINNNAFLFGWLFSNRGVISGHNNPSFAVNFDDKTKLCITATAPFHSEEQPLEVIFSMGVWKSNKMTFSKSHLSNISISPVNGAENRLLKVNIKNPFTSSDEYNGLGLLITNISFQ